LSIACALCLANQILFLWKNIRITIIEHWTDIVLHHPFDNGTGTWSAATMQKYGLRHRAEREGKIRIKYSIKVF
jgi:hypothetical protein